MWMQTESFGPYRRLKKYDYSAEEAEEAEGWHLDTRRGPAGFAFDTKEYLRAFAEAGKRKRPMR